MGEVHGESTLCTACIDGLGLANPPMGLYRWLAYECKGIEPTARRDDDTRPSTYGRSVRAPPSRGILRKQHYERAVTNTSPALTANATRLQETVQKI